MPSEQIARRLEQMTEHLQAHNQEQVLVGTDSLDEHRLEEFLDQLASIDLDEIDQLTARAGVQHDHADDDVAVPQPAPYIPRDGAEAEAFRAAGEEIIARGGVAAFTVAGGQGTRLGWGGPKGTYPATPVSGKPLFRVFAEQIEAASQRWLCV